MQNLYCPDFDPVMFSFGSISFYWYGMMYVLGFIWAMWSLIYNQNVVDKIFSDKLEIEYLLFLSFIGILIGGRVGYVIFYQWTLFSGNLLWIFKIWEGGMSFHGGLIGAIVSIMLFSCYKNKSFFQVSDFIVPVIPVGLGLGRLGNFINGELWGRVSIDLPWAMLFKNAILEDVLLLNNHPEWQEVFNYYGMLPRHPSQLYEAVLEGIVLFVIMHLFNNKNRPAGSISGLFLICYGLFRIVVEFYRAPDSHLGLIFDFVTLGQILSFPMVLCGGIILYLSYR